MLEKLEFPVLNVRAIKELKETSFLAFGGLFLEGPFWLCVYGAPESGGSEGALRKAKIFKRTAMEAPSRRASVPGRSPPGIAVRGIPFCAEKVRFSRFRRLRHRCIKGLRRGAL